MAGCCAPALQLCGSLVAGGAYLVAGGVILGGCRAPALQLCGSLVAGGASLVAGGVSQVAGGASLVAGGASWHPRPHIAAGHPGRGTHPPISAAALSLKWVRLRIFFNRLLLYLSII